VLTSPLVQCRPWAFGGPTDKDAEYKSQAAVLLRPSRRERAQEAARGRQIEAEAAPIVYVVEMLGVGGDSERAIRWLIALMMLCCDPLAIALTAATGRSDRPDHTSNVNHV
jgi:hypothetical protein